MIDGLKSTDYISDDIEVKDDLIVADYISGAGMDIFGSTANIETISGTALVGTTVNSAGKLVGTLGTGSPATTWGKVALAGTGATDGGSAAWHTFPTAFSAAPIVVASSTETNEALLIPAGSIGVGSFYCETTSASQAFSWVAIG